ncbi:MAG: hypothetical protein E7174_04895 [Firmicutes bacterium]|nr:hypothetical protein [Bacillota bacterium]
MNYYNPYFYTMPTTLSTPKTGFLSRIFGTSGVTLSGILNGTQRALNFANQAIPFVKQVRPMIGNAKTMFKVMNEFKRAEKPKEIKNVNNMSINTNNNKNINIIENNNEINQNNYTTTENGPTFFM